MTTLIIFKVNFKQLLSNFGLANVDVFNVHNDGYVGIGQQNSGASLVEVSDVNGYGITGVPLLEVDNGTPADPYFMVRGSSTGVQAGIGVDQLALGNSSTLALKGVGATTFDIYEPVLASWDGQIRFLAPDGEVRHVIADDAGTGNTNNLIIFPGFGGGANGVVEIEGNEQVNGTVTIGTVTAPAGYNLYVQNGILTERVKVALASSSDWSDYVFSKDYKMMDLGDLNSYIQKNKHLPDILSADETVKNGIDLGQMDAKLLAKVEELTLYIIKQQQELDALKKQIKAK